MLATIDVTSTMDTLSAGVYLQKNFLVARCACMWDYHGHFILHPLNRRSFDKAMLMWS